MATVKYFYIEDDTAILFGANGTALTASLAAVGGLISETKIPLPTFPLWAFFVGLIFAFLCRVIVTAYNGDIREREKSQSVRDFAMEVAADKRIPDDQKPDLNTLWVAMEERRKLLLTEIMVRRLDRWRLFFFISSVISFLAGTSSILLYVGSHSANSVSSA